MKLELEHLNIQEEPSNRLASILWRKIDEMMKEDEEKEEQHAKTS